MKTKIDKMPCFWRYKTTQNLIYIRPQKHYIKRESVLLPNVIHNCKFLPASAKFSHLASRASLASRPTNRRGPLQI